MEREKKASPMASSTPDMPSLLKSGIRKRHPGHGARQVRPKATSSRISDEEGRASSSAGALHPCCTPPRTNHQVKPANSRWVGTGQSRITDIVIETGGRAAPSPC